jgi:hypothetical protein
VSFSLINELTFPRCCLIPFHNGLSTVSNDSIPYGAAASANAAIPKAVIVRTFCCSSTRPKIQIKVIKTKESFLFIRSHHVQ